MHDSFLNLELYDAVLDLCRLYSITKATELVVSVHTDSHITKESLLEQFTSRNSNIVGDWTEIVVQKKDIEKLTAVIEHFDGLKNIEI